MNAWKVDPEQLRSAAAIVARAGEIVEGVTTTAPTSDVGHAELASALSAFMEALTGGWMQRVSQTKAVAQTLLATAALYEAADDESAQDLRRVGDR